MAKKREAGGAGPEIFNGGIVTPRIGAVWGGQGGIFAGLIRGAGDQPDYCLVIPPASAAKFSGIWGTGARVTGAESEYDGLANTQAMAAAGSDIATRAMAIEHEGHKDFYIPARREARILQANCGDLYPKEWHWTSTQDAGYSDYAWVQYFGHGNQSHDRKSNSWPVLLVRRLPVIR